MSTLSRIKFIPATYTWAEIDIENEKWRPVAKTRYTINLKIDDVLFETKLRFDTEEQAQAKIESLKSFLKPKPKNKLLEAPKND